MTNESKLPNDLADRPSIPSRSFFIAVVLLATVTSVAYVGTLQNEFVECDDQVYVTSNPYTRDGLSRQSFCYAWTTFDSGNWIPLTWLSYQLDATLFGVRSSAFHATNMVLHCCNVLLLFGWLARVTGLNWRSFAVAAIFAVHPLHVESVAWVAERKDVLSAFWMLVALFAYERYASRPGRWSYSIVCFTFMLGLLSKSMLVTFPLLLLLVDFWPMKRWRGAHKTPGTTSRYPQRTAQQLLVEKMPLLVLSLVDGILTIIAQGTGESQTSAIVSLAKLPLTVRLGNAVLGYGWYIAKTIWPTELCMHYAHPLNGLEWYRVAMAGVLLAGISLYSGVNGFKRPYLLFGWLWFLLSLLPVIGLLQVGTQAYADRYSYIPHIGLILAIVWDVDYWFGRSRIGNILNLIAASVVIGILGVMTALQVNVWKTTEALWEQALVVDSKNWVAHLQLGNLRVVNGRTDECTLGHLQMALGHNPEHAIALNNAGWIYQCRDNWKDAEDYYRRSLAADIQNSAAMHNLVVVLKKQQRLARELGLIKKYADQCPNDAIIQNELGLLYARRGEIQLAKDRFAQAVNASPDHTASRNNLALALAQLGQDREAQLQLETVISQQPENANAHVNLADLLEKSGQVAMAREHFAAALHYNPKDQEARDRLEAIEKRLASQQPTP